MVSNTSEMELKMKLMENYVSSELKEDEDSKKKYKKTNTNSLKRIFSRKGKKDPVAY